jgi:hypothetical protein
VKHRLISDCRLINNHLQPKKFKLEHWKDIFPSLRKGMWGCKIDLKHAYFHLPLHPELKEYLNIKVGEKFFQFQAAPFGLSTLPEIWTRIMKVFQKKWRAKGILCWIYLDDILVVGKNPKRLEKDMAVVIQDLKDAGMAINDKKSILEPSQNIQHLGFNIDFRGGCKSPKTNSKA